jgi:hypothetical protein
MNSRVRLLFTLGCLGILVFSQLSAQFSKKRPKLEILREIDLEEGRQRLNSFRQMWVVGDYSLLYSLEFIPRRGDRLEISGTLWGSNAADGPVSLVQLNEDPSTQFYIKNGPIAFVSKKQEGVHDWQPIPVTDWFNSIDDKVTLTAFDLMMPFIYWSEWTYEGVTKTRSRVAHAFLMEAPDSLKDNPLGLHGVVVFLDESFNALLKADYVTKDDVVIKSLHLIDIKKVDGDWLPKTMDFLDESTRDKTRLTIKAAAMHSDFSDHSLGRGELPESVPEIPISSYTTVK